MKPIDVSAAKPHIRCPVYSYLIPVSTCETFFRTTGPYSHPKCKTCHIGMTKDYSDVLVDLQVHVQENPARPHTRATMPGVRSA